MIRLAVFASGGAPMRHLHLFFNIREGEGKPLFLLLVYFFFFGATLTVSKTARDAYFLNRFDVSYLPLMFLAAAGAVALTVVVYSTISKRLGLIPTISLSGFIFAITLILIQSRLEGGLIPFLYVWVDVITTVIMVQFSVVAEMVFNSQQAKRLFGIILAGSPIARIAIGAGITPFVKRFGSDYLLTLAAGFIVCCVLMAWLIKLYAFQDKPEDSPSEKKSGKARVFDSYLKMIAIAAGAAAIATVIVEYQFLMIAKDYFPSEEELASFFGFFYSMTGAVSLFMQLFLTGWILNRFGILKGMLILPVGLGIGSIAILINPVILSSLIARISEQITKFTVDKTSILLLWVPVSPDRKQNHKLIIDGTIKTGLQGLTGVLIFMLVTVWHMPHPLLMKTLSLIALVAIGVWILSASRLKKGYISALMSAIEKRRLDFEQMRLDTTDSHIIETIEKALDSDDDAQQVFVLDVIENLSLSPWKDTLNRLFQDGSFPVQKKILTMTADSPEILSNEELRKKIEEKGPLAKDAIVIAGKRGMTDMTPALRHILENTGEGEADIRVAAAAAMLIMNQEPLDLAQSTLEDLLKSEDESQNVLALQMMLHIPSLLDDIQLRECLKSDSIRICMAVLDIAHQRNDVQLLPGIIHCMRHTRTVMTARGVLRTYPAEDVVAALCHICIQPDTPSRLKIEIVRTFKAYPDPSAVLCLVRMLAQSSRRVQSEIVPALLEIARETPLSADILHRLGMESEKIVQEIYSHYEMLNMIATGRDSLLLRDLFRSGIQESIPILFMLLLLHKPETPVETYLTYVQSGEIPQIANLLEILDNILPRRENNWIIPLLKPMSVSDRCRAGQRLFNDLPRNADDELLRLIQSPNQWHVAVAMDYILRKGNRPVLERIDWMSFPDHGIQHEVISRHLIREEGLFDNLPQFSRAHFLPSVKEDPMLSILEKTIILKGTDLFEGVPGEEIYHVAQVMEEERLNEDVLLFQKGDIGDYLYIIVTGEILIHIDDREINRHTKGDHLGEMALLDDAPRSTSATALEETLLLKISQDNFEDIMMPHKGVRKGIMRILNERFRRLTDRYAEADA